MLVEGDGRALPRAWSLHQFFMAQFTFSCHLPPTLFSPCMAAKIMDPAGNLRQDIEQALRRPNLTTWQRTFLTDIHAQLERSRGQARLSDKQWRKVFEILGRATGTSTVPSPPALRQPTTGQKGSRFRQRFMPRRKRLDRGLQKLAIGFLFVGLVAVGQQVAEYGRGQFPQTPVTNAASDMPRFTVTDGDTVHVIGDDAGTRLVGFNTPEKFSPQCESERQLGERASLRLKELVSKGVARLTKVACACAPGTEGSEKCNHGRSCGNAAGRRRRRRKHLDPGRSRCTVRVHRNTLPADAAALVWWLIPLLAYVQLGRGGSSVEERGCMNVPAVGNDVWQNRYQKIIVLEAKWGHRSLEFHLALATPSMRRGRS